MTYFYEFKDIHYTNNKAKNPLKSYYDKQNKIILTSQGSNRKSSIIRYEKTPRNCCSTAISRILD